MRRLVPNPLTLLSALLICLSTQQFTYGFFFTLIALIPFSIELEKRASLVDQLIQGGWIQIALGLATFYGWTAQGAEEIWGLSAWAFFPFYLVAAPLVHSYLIAFVLCRFYARRYLPSPLLALVVGAAVYASLSDITIFLNVILANQLFRAPALLSFAEFGGGVFVTFLIVLAAQLFAMIWVVLSSQSRFTRLIASASPILLFVMASTVYDAARTPPSSSETIKVSLLQTNEYLSPEEKTRSGAEQIRLLIESDQKKLALLQKANKQHPESALFVFPENTFKDFFFQPLDEAQRINKSAADSAFGEIRKPLIYGGLYTTESGIANDLFFTRIENDRLQTVSFRKNRPMPFGEEIPGERWIPFLKGRSPTSKMAPPSLAPIRGSLNGIMWGGFICNEAFYPELMASHRMAGARFAIGIGNEYTVRDTLGQDHLLAAAVVRAIESGIPIFKVSNYGGTFSIDAQGRVRDRLPNNQDGILFSELALASKEPTFFAKHPYWFHYVAAILIAFSAALITMKQWQNRTGTDQ